MENELPAIGRPSHNGHMRSPKGGQLERPGTVRFRDPDLPGAGPGGSKSDLLAVRRVTGQAVVASRSNQKVRRGKRSPRRSNLGAPDIGVVDFTSVCKMAAQAQRGDVVFQRQDPVGSRGTRSGDDSQLMWSLMSFG